jgi:hypothetical protein
MEIMNQRMIHDYDNKIQRAVLQVANKRENWALPLEFLHLPFVF